MSALVLNDFSLLFSSLLLSRSGASMNERSSNWYR